MIVSILIFLVVLSVLILVHELGHFFAARRAGVWVEEFGFGLPPRVVGKKIGETIYSLNLLPFGGFVRLHGEDKDDGILKPKRAFLNQKKRTRIAIVLAGVLMNFLLAVFAFTVVYSFSGIPRETGNVRVVEIVENSPASESGLVIGDLLREIEGQAIDENSDFIGIVEESKGNEITVLVEREGEMHELITTPREDPPEGEGALGVVITSTEIFFPPIWQRPFYGVYYGFQESLFWSGLVISGFIKIFSDLFVGVLPQDVAGPVGIFALTSEAAKFGILPLINFVGILSVNLAILNAMPFPALDGGRLLFIGIETFFGRKVVPKIEAAIHTVGLIILLILILAITAQDIKRLINAGGVSGYIQEVIK